MSLQPGTRLPRPAIGKSSGFVEAVDARRVVPLQLSSYGPFVGVSAVTLVALTPQTRNISKYN